MSIVKSIACLEKLMTERKIHFIKKRSKSLQILLCIVIFLFPIAGSPICSFATESGQRPIEPVDAYDRLSDAFMAVPEPNPPRIEEADRTSPELLGNATPRSTTIMVEWTYHKTMDNEHPDDIEQQLLWLTNRARANPSQEGQWLKTVDDPYIDMARSYFEVNLALLQDEFASYAVKPPAAFDVRLYNAAKAHSEDLIQRDAQDHNQQFDHIDAAGFVYSQVRGIVFSYAYTALYGHAAFNIDWGVGISPRDAEGSRSRCSGSYCSIFSRFSTHCKFPSAVPGTCSCLADGFNDINI